MKTENISQQPHAAGEAAHTPTPWQIIGGHIYAPQSHIAPFTDKDGVRHDDYMNGLVALVYSGHTMEDSARLGLAHGSIEGNRAFIVRACNSHAELLAWKDAAILRSDKLHAEKAALVEALRMARPYVKASADANDVTGWESNSRRVLSVIDQHLSENA